MTTSPEDVPNVARIYDYVLGGAHNFAVDRELARQALAIHPDATSLAWSNRTFLRHAVEDALDLGIDQFLDLGSGIPTVGNVHEIAHRRNPEARIAYVDVEPVAAAHSREILAEVEHTSVTQADIRDPDTVLGAPGVAGLLDFSRPVAVLAVAVLHFIPDADDPARMLAGYRRQLSAGSVLALSHSSADYPDDPEFIETRRRMLELYAGTSHPSWDRTRAELRALVESAGFAVDADGLVEFGRWAPPQHDGRPLGGYALITEPLGPPTTPQTS